MSPFLFARLCIVSLVLDVEDDPAAYTLDLIPADPAMAKVVREAEEADADP